MDFEENIEEEKEIERITRSCEETEYENETYEYDNNNLIMLLDDLAKRLSLQRDVSSFSLDSSVYTTYNYDFSVYPPNEQPQLRVAKEQNVLLSETGSSDALRAFSAQYSVNIEGNESSSFSLSECEVCNTHSSSANYFGMNKNNRVLTSYCDNEKEEFEFIPFSSHHDIKKKKM
jgi:hypothetical protein